MIGRIIPGLFFIACLIYMFGFPSGVALPGEFINQAKQGHTTDFILLLGISALFTGVAAYGAGFLMGAISYFPCEKWIWSARKLLRFPELDFQRLFGEFGGESEDSEALKETFEACFGFKLDEKSGPLQRQSWICSYYVWGRNANLGQMASRWDAEALASRNILFAAMILFILRFFQVVWNHCCVCQPLYWKFSLFLLVVSIGGQAMYAFERRKQILGRFSLFYALAPKVQRTGENRNQ